MTQNLRSKISALLFWSLAVSGAAASDLSVTVSVDNASPTAGNPVEFMVTVTNNGPDAATGVEVLDALPAALQIPAGTAAFTSQGAYDVQTGIWTVGQLAATANAVLTIPAILTSAAAPPCAVNAAELRAPLDSDNVADNDRASVAVYVDGSTSCLDLTITAAASAGNADGCLGTRTTPLAIQIANLGPDVATAVEITVMNTPEPTFRFGFEGCDSFTSTVCTLTALDPGTQRDVIARVSYDTGTTATYDVAVIASEPDLQLADNMATSQLSFTAPAGGDCGIPDDIGIPIGGGCFIATAAYGSYLHPQVQTLRRFRDKWLLSNWPGRQFVRLYYRYSPPLASTIARNENLRTLSRWALTPVVFSIVHPWRAIMVGLAAVLLLRARRKSRH